MNEIIQLGFVLLCAATPFILMPIMWRQMKKARQAGHDKARERPVEQPWQEDQGGGGAKDYRPNDDLITQGAKANQTGSVLDKS